MHYIQVGLRLFKENFNIIIFVFTNIILIISFLSAMNYYSNFGVKYIYIASAGDYLKLPLSNGNTGMMIFSFLFISTLGISILSVLKSTNEALMNMKVGLLIISIGVVLLTFKVNDSTSLHDIKTGFAIRHDVHTQDEIFKCSIIIGSTSSHLVVWDVTKKQAVLLPQSVIKKIISVGDPVLPRSNEYHGVAGGKGKQRLTPEEKQEWILKTDNACQLPMRKESSDDVSLLDVHLL